MGAYTGIQNFFKVPIVDLAKKLHYSEDNILILESNWDRVKLEYPETYKNVCSHKYKQDKRTPEEFGQDVTASWLFEDVFRYYFKSKKYEIILNGTDKTRTWNVPDDSITTQSDFKIIYNNRGYNLELMTDYTEFISINNKYHLRDYKLAGLKKTKSFLLIISTVDKTFVLVDWTKPHEYKSIESHEQFGGKPAYEVYIDDDFIPLTVENMEQQIIQKIQNR